MNSAKTLISILLLFTTVDASPTQWEFNQILDNILFVRTPDSYGIAKVQSFISNFFERLKPHWQFETDEFEELTVLGMKKFKNLIARFRPNCPHFIVLGKNDKHIRLNWLPRFEVCKGRKIS